jgi:MFS family permease
MQQDGPDRAAAQPAHLIQSLEEAGCVLRRAERARAVTTVFGGLDVGSAVGLLLCGPLIHWFGWQSVFYLFALLGLVWCLAWPLFKPEQQDLGEAGCVCGRGGGDGAWRDALLRSQRCSKHTHGSSTGWSVEDP